LSQSAIVLQALYAFLPQPLSRMPHLPSNSNSSRSLFLLEWGEAEVWLDYAEVREQLLGLLVLDTGVDDNIITRDPVDGCSDSVLVTSLKRVDDSEDLGRVTTGRSRI